MVRNIAVVFALVVVVFGISQLFNTREVTGGQVTAAFSGIDASCETCSVNLHTALSNIIGIKQTRFDRSKHVLTVTFNSSVMKASWIAHSLEAAGFHPKDVEIIEQKQTG
ncbi:MAG TPA: hypothetical protein VFK44_14865 [Bacillales bacterium]|nr:hypothetical protein [Bacillales bacterium]